MKRWKQEGPARAVSIATRTLSAAIPASLSDENIRRAFNLPPREAPFWATVVVRIGQAAVRAGGHGVDARSGLNVTVLPEPVLRKAR